MKARSKPVEREFIRFNGNNAEEVKAFCAGRGVEVNYDRAGNSEEESKDSKWMFINTGKGTKQILEGVVILDDNGTDVQLMSSAAFRNSWEVIDPDMTSEPPVPAIKSSPAPDLTGIDLEALIRLEIQKSLGKPGALQILKNDDE